MPSNLETIRAQLMLGEKKVLKIYTEQIKYLYRRYSVDEEKVL